MVDFTLARLIKAPEIDIGQSLHRAAQLRQMETANQLGQFNMREAMEKRGALGEYARGGDVGTLKAYPDLYQQAQANDQATEQAKALRNARRAQRVIGLEGPDQLRAWQEEIDDAHRAGDLPSLMYQRLRGQPPNAEMLHSIINQAVPLQSVAKDQPIIKEADKPLVSIERDPITRRPVARELTPGRPVDGFKDAKQRADVEEGLRKEFAALAKPYFEVRDAYSRIEQAAKAPSPAGDMALIFNFMKILDPGSVVREGEFATAQNAAGVPERIMNLYNRLLSGERLNPNQREDFVSQARGLTTVQERQYQTIQKQYEAIAKRTGVNPENTILNFGKPPAPALTPRATPPGGGQGQIPPPSIRHLEQIKMGAQSVTLGDGTTLSAQEYIRVFEDKYGKDTARQFLTPR